MLKLMYITNDPRVARIAEDAGVDRIFVDLEVIGKAERQKGMDTVKSHHTLDDVKLIRQNLQKADLLVRSNPIHENSCAEIDTIIANGADIVMLPYFKTTDEVSKFIRYVGGRAKVCLLLETAEAVERLDDILALQGIDEVHIGLNDLHLSYHMKFMFELLADGTVDRIVTTLKNKHIPYGFGGIARIGCGDLPAEDIIKEHYRLGSSMVILSRGFCNTNIVENLEDVSTLFHKGVNEIRLVEKEAQQHLDYFETNRLLVQEKVNLIKQNIKK